MRSSLSFRPTPDKAQEVRFRHLVWRVLLLTLVIAVMGPQLHAQVQVSGHAGQQQADAASAVVLNDLPLISAANRSIPGRFSGMRPASGISDSEYLVRKAEAAQIRFSPRVSSALMPRSAGVDPETPGASRNYNGINETCAFVTPSDMAIAVGIGYVLQVVNDCLAVFDKSGTVQSGYPKSVNTFFGLPANNFSIGRFTTDPRAVYDWVSNRYFFEILWEDLPNSRGYVMLAASNTNDPRGGWHTYKIQVGGAGRCPDFPALGQGPSGDPANGAFAIGFNVFSCSPSGLHTLVDDQVWFLPKAAMYRGAGFGFNFFYGPNARGVLLDTIQPSNDESVSDKPRAIFGVNSFNINSGGVQCRQGCNGLVVWSFSNVLQRTGSPGLEFAGRVISTPSNYSLPPAASQPGGRNTVDTGDTRISGTVFYTGGSLWAAINTNNGGGGPAVLSWQIHPTLDDNDPRCTGAFVNYCPRVNGASIEQEVSYAIGGGTSLNAYYGTIIPDPERNVTMVFNFSGDNAYPGVAYTTNRVTNVPGHWHDSGIFLAQGQSFYSQTRWGDFTGACLDLSYSPYPKLWFSGMYARSDHNWGTRIGRNGYSFSNEP